MQGPLRGAFSPPNKAEAAGALLALFRPTPLHIGVDDALAVANLNRIIQGTRTEAAKPWVLIPHGGIWKTVEAAKKQRGPGTPRVTKVEGHATAQHVADEIITEEQRKGNNITDNLATKACDSPPPHIREFADPTSHRTQHCAELAQVIRLTILMVIEAIQERRRTMAIISPVQQGFVFKGAKRRPLIPKPRRYEGQQNN